MVKSGESLHIGIINQEPGITWPVTKGIESNGWRATAFNSEADLRRAIESGTFPRDFDAVLTEIYWPYELPGDSIFPTNPEGILKLLDDANYKGPRIAFSTFIGTNLIEPGELEGMGLIVDTGHFGMPARRIDLIEGIEHHVTQYRNNYSSS